MRSFDVAFEHPSLPERIAGKSAPTEGGGQTGFINSKEVFSSIRLDEYEITGPDIRGCRLMRNKSQRYRLV